MCYCRFVYQDEAIGQERVLVEYLREVYGLACASDEYQQVKKWALALVGIWPAGIPLLYSCLLAVSSNAIRHRTPTGFKQATAFLWQGGA